MGLEEVIHTVLDEFKTIASADTMVGKPMQIGNSTIIPVSKVSIGFAGGGRTGAEKGASGSGTGGGATVEPIAFIVVKDGNVTIEKIKATDLGLSDFIEKVPPLVAKLFKKKSSGEEAKKKEEA